MSSIVANTSVLVPSQFPAWFRENGPVFIEFVKAYYEWMETANNATYYVRNYYNIKDIDNTFDQFIVYFKEKYLKNIQFTTAADIRQVIKHALDIYRSKGTERCTTLIFQLAFDERPQFYYPGTDLFKLSDGKWTVPMYLELALSDMNPLIQQKEVKGVSSGAIAFVDNVIRRNTLGRLEDVAYVSAITGDFEVGEIISPTDSSLSIDDCPVIAGSLNTLLLPALGSGQNYPIGTISSLSSNNGFSAVGRVSNNSSLAQGIVEFDFEDGGWGFQTNSNIYISNVVLSFANLQVNTSSVGSANSMITGFANAEDVHYFAWLDTITQPMATLNYVGANGSFTAGANLTTYYGNGGIMGTGVVLDINQTNSTAGVLVVNILSGNVDNTVYTTSNAISANLAVSNGYTNTTATGVFIANNDYMTLLLANTSGEFVLGEEVFQQKPLYGPVTNEKTQGWGICTNIINATAIQVGNVSGRFIPGDTLSTVDGAFSKASANIVGVDISLGVVNTVGSFIQAPYSYAYSPRTYGALANVASGGSGFTVLIANSLLNTTNVHLNTDSLMTYANVALAATSYGFPGNITANSSNVFINSAMTNVFPQVGKLASVIIGGQGINYQTPPFIVIDEPLVSPASVYNDIIEYTGATGQFAMGEKITQSTNSTVTVHGFVLNSSNSTYLIVQRATFSEIVPGAHDFIVTSNSSTQITGTTSGVSANVTNVDYDFMSAVMGRNTIIAPTFATGNDVATAVQVIDSGFGFVNGETVTIGSNGAYGYAIVGGIGTGQGYYEADGGFLSAQKKLFDGWFYQNFSYQIISRIMQSKYQSMMQELTHPAGTIMFSDYIYATQDHNKAAILNANTVIT